MDYLKTIVSGKKKRFIDRKYNLDLSYILNIIIINRESLLLRNFIN